MTKTDCGCPEGLAQPIHQHLTRFVAFPNDHYAVTATMWVFHAHTADTAESTPRLAFLSPEPGFGKSRALEVLAALGTYLDPRNALRDVKGWAEKAGLDAGVCVHTMRHTSATAQLDAGLSPKVVAEVLGHSDTRVTMETYAHALDPAKARAVKASAALFGAG